jgi:hypothetical protein
LKYLTLLCLIAGLFVAGPALAQTESIEHAAPAPAHDLKLAIALWTAAVASDQATTYQFSSRYPTILHEKNPLIRGLDQHPAGLVAAGAAIDAASAWAAYHFFGERHPRLVTIAFIAAATYRAHLAVHNLQMMEQAASVQAATPAWTLPQH